MNYRRILLTSLGIILSTAITSVLAIGAISVEAGYSHSSTTSIKPLAGVGSPQPTPTHAIEPTDTALPTATPTSTPNGASCVSGWEMLPDAPGNGGVILSLAPDDVWVGTRNCGAFCPPNLVHYDGVGWTTHTPMQAGRGGAQYTGLAGTTTNDVWAIGTNSTVISYSYFSFAVHWDGVKWAGIPCHDCPAISPSYLLYFDVVAVGPGEAVIVGSLVNMVKLPHYSAVVLHCTVSAGCSWESPIGPVESRLLGVDSTAPDDIWGVGWITNTTHPLALHWDGATWTPQETPDIDQLWDVIATAPDNAWAVGDAGILKWDGVTWIQQYNEHGGYSIAARTASDIWSVGYISHHWDGFEWTIVLTPTPLYSVSIDPLGNAWAVGGYIGEGVARYQNAQRFSDVTPADTFYSYVQCIACEGIITGYPCGGPGEPCASPDNRPYFRSGSPLSRGQLAKIVSNSAGFEDDPGEQVYEDVPPGSPFYDFVQRLTNRSIIAGYPCDESSQEPCVPPGNRPYFRPNGTATRGQTSKIISEAAGFTEPHTAQTFEDVSLDNSFYIWIERLASRNIIAGYPCGGVEEPCVEPGNRPYFRPAALVSRGQTAKITSTTFFPGCSTGLDANK